MDWPWVLCGAGLGLLVGSFIGAVALRLPRDENVVTGRSRCDGCGRVLAVRDLVPVFSYMLCKGRCRTCGVPIDRQHVLAELGGAAIGAVALALGSDWFEVGASVIFGWQLLLLALLDGRHFWLPMRLVALLAASSIIVTLGALADWQAVAIAQVAGGALGFVLLAAPALAYRWLRGQDGMGKGDPWLLGAIGLWLGMMGVIATLLLAALAGIAAAVVLKLAGKEVDSQSAMPLGLFLALSAIAVRMAGFPL